MWIFNITWVDFKWTFCTKHNGIWSVTYRNDRSYKIRCTSDCCVEWTWLSQYKIYGYIVENTRRQWRRQSVVHGPVNKNRRHLQSSVGQAAAYGDGQLGHRTPWDNSSDYVKYFNFYALVHRYTYQYPSSFVHAYSIPDTVHMPMGTRCLFIYNIYLTRVQV